ncbi:MAG: PHP domain-containing protein [Anaerolineae bacterium]|nr:PHP domain-containing protein [Anaerolineae bacterium]
MKKTDIYADFHVHTHISPCGKPAATLQAMIHRAAEKGLAAIGFADHCTPCPVPGCTFYDTQRIDILTRLRAELADVPLPDGLEVLVGVEADYTLAGAGCIDEAMLHQCDHIIGAASHFHLPAAPVPAEDTAASKAELMALMARELLVLPGISVWAHPFDCSAMRPLLPILAAVEDSVLADLITLANRHRVAIEINGGAAQHPAYREAASRFFQQARNMGARFTVTADAHHPNDFERLDIAVDWALAMGFRESDFVTVSELRASQQEKMRTIFSVKVR